MIRIMPNPAKIYKALLYSLAGLFATFRTERAFRQEVVVAVVLTPVALWLGRSGVEKALLIGSLILIMIIELINTAIEILVDRISPEHHVLSGRAKDVGSASVFISILLAVMIWAVVLLN